MVDGLREQSQSLSSCALLDADFSASCAPDHAPLGYVAYFEYCFVGATQDIVSVVAYTSETLKLLALLKTLTSWEVLFEMGCRTKYMQAGNQIEVTG